MPIHCPLALPRITADEMREIDYAVMGHAFAVHRELGRLCDESVYRLGLLHRLEAAGISVDIEVPVTLSFREFSTTLKMDLVVESKAIYELKTVSAFSSAHESQLLCYLFLNNATRGKLVNFRNGSVEAKFVNTSMELIDRRQFDLDSCNYTGEAELRVLIHDLLNDWGTGLSSSLYRRAILQCIGTDIRCEQQLPMSSNGHPLGNQRFHMIDNDTALGVTTYSQPTTANLKELEKLISFSPLYRLHWVNITHHQVQLATIMNGRKI